MTTTEIIMVAGLAMGIACLFAGRGWTAGAWQKGRARQSGQRAQTTTPLDSAGRPDVTPTREGARMKKLACLAAAMIVGTLVLVGAVATPKASAWSWSSNVTLNGTISAPWTLLGDQVQWAWVAAGDGECGWAYLGSATSNHSRAYSFDFARVPFAGTCVTVTAEGSVTALGQRQTSFWLYRPVVGTYATRNVYWNY